VTPVNEDGGARQGLRRVLSLFVVAAFLLAAVFFARSHWEELKALRVVAPWAIAAIGLLFVGNLVARGLFTCYVLRAFDVKISARECITLGCATSMTNFLMPMRSGAGLKAVYLKRLHGLPYTTFVSTMAAFYLFFIFVNSAIGVVAAGWFWLNGTPPSLGIFVTLGGALLGSGFLIFFAPFVRLPEGRIASKVARVVEGWDKIRSDPPVLAAAFATVIANSAFAATGFYAGFHAFSLPISVPGVTLLMSSQTIGGLASFTPGAVGFQETIGMYFSSSLEATVAQTFAVLAAVRLIKICVSVLLGVPSVAFLSRLREAAQSG
jgi:uncharacterized membrane protein YbhN (UPF0104 family)